MLLLLACTGEPADTCAEAAEVTEFAVTFDTEPSPVQARGEATFTVYVRDQRGCPVEDLVSAHKRMVHTLLISEDLTSFQHLHMEDYQALTADDLRTSSFYFPVTLPRAGDYRLVFDYAWQNDYLTADDWMTVEGGPAMGAVELDYTTEKTVGDLAVSLRWDVEPVAGYEAAWTILVYDTAGNEVTDLVQYLGADAHAAVVTTDLAWTSHTHAWYPGMEDVAPGHDMVPLHQGPDLPFHYVFPVAGPHKMWVQFVRDGVDEVYVVPFVFDVAP